MKKIIFYPAIIINLFFSTQLLAQESKSPLYFQFGTGIAINNGKETDSEPSTKPAKIKHDNVQAFSASLGYIYTPNIRFSVSLDYLPEWKISSNNIDSYGLQTYYDTELSSLASRFNVYYDFAEIANSVIVPYVTTGLGISINHVGNVEEFIDGELSGVAFGNSKSNFTWNFGTGASYKLSSNLLVDLSYNYSSLGNVTTKSGYDANYQGMSLSSHKVTFKNLYSHRILLSLRVKL